MFFREKNSEFEKDLESDEFFLKLAYLSDIFEALNNMNLFFQGPNSSISDFVSKLEAFIRKLEIWINNLGSKQFGMFKLLTSLQRQPNEKMFEEMRCHLNQLEAELMHYFPAMERCAYLNNPFTINPSLLPVGTREQEDIIDIQCDQAARTKHKECSPLNFWLSMSSTYQSLAPNAIPHLLVFPCTWECDQGFSAMMSIRVVSRAGLFRSGSGLKLKKVSGLSRACDVAYFLS